MNTDPFVGEICLWTGSFVPKYWVPCDGRLLNIKQHLDLFALIATQFGGDGKTTFGVPDLRGRTPIGATATAVTGTAGGARKVVLDVSNLPAHTHPIWVTDATADKEAPAGNAPGGGSPDPYYIGAPDTMLSPEALSKAGGTMPHDNMQPYVVMQYLIATTGIFPSHN